jgi:hypothetical protein
MLVTWVAGLDSTRVPTGANMQSWLIDIRVAALTLVLAGSCTVYGADVVQVTGCLCVNCAHAALAAATF